MWAFRIMGLFILVAFCFMLRAAFFMGRAEGYNDCEDLWKQPDTCACCRIEISHQGDKDLIQVLKCFENHHTRCVIVKDAMILNSKY